MKKYIIVYIAIGKLVIRAVVWLVIFKQRKEEKHKTINISGGVIDSQ
tara:strand:+ start:1374 stop:1514 length:141 start_codon:yes stop_codon:yes gene_type:complete